MRSATVAYSGSSGSDALDLPAATKQAQQESSVVWGFEPVACLSFGLAMTATGLLVLVSDFLDLTGVEQRQGAAGAQSSSLTAGTHPSGSGSRLAVQADTAALQKRLVEVVSLELWLESECQPR